jgi:hypothetical protein
MACAEFNRRKIRFDPPPPLQNSHPFTGREDKDSTYLEFHSNKVDPRPRSTAILASPMDMI